MNEKIFNRSMNSKKLLRYTINIKMNEINLYDMKN